MAVYYTNKTAAKVTSTKDATDYLSHFLCRFWQAFEVWGITSLFWQMSSVPPASKYDNLKDQAWQVSLFFFSCFEKTSAIAHNIAKIPQSDIKKEQT